MENSLDIIANKEFQKKIDDFKKDWYKFYKKISKTDTPKYDGTGNEIVRKRPDELDYIIEAYMKDRLNHYFPGWSWRRTGNVQIIGSYWVVTDGELCIIDERLIAMGINPPYRYFAASGAARIQFKKNMPQTPENLVDLDKNVKAANTNAFKKAINQLTGIGDDVYGKRIEEEGGGSIENIIMQQGKEGSDTAKKAFNQYVKDNRVSWSKVFEILEISSLTEVTDYAKAFNKVKKYVEGGDAS